MNSNRTWLCLSLLLLLFTSVSLSCDRSGEENPRNSVTEASLQVTPTDGGSGGGDNQQDAPHWAVDPNNPLFVEEESDQGALHNEFLLRLHSRRSLIEGGPVDELAYRQIMVDVANEVLQARDSEERVTLSDMTFLAHQCHYVAYASGFTLADVPEDAGHRLLLFLESSGRISTEEREALEGYLEGLYSGTVEPSTPITVDGAMESDAVRIFRIVAGSSRDLWNSMRPYEVPGTNSWSEFGKWAFEVAIDAGYTMVLGGSFIATLAGAYMSGAVHLTFIQLDAPDGDPDDCCCSGCHGPCWVCTQY